MMNLYINRKHFHSFNVQIVCDAQMLGAAWFKIKIKIRFIVMLMQEIHKFTTPLLTHPGQHLLNTHMHRVTHS